MEENWISIYSTDQQYEASLLESILKDNDIDCVVMDKKVSQYVIGEIEVYVPTADALRAKQLVIEFKGE